MKKTTGTCLAAMLIGTLAGSTGNAAENGEIEKLRQALKQGEKGSIEEVKKSNVSTQKVLVPGLIRTYLEGPPKQTEKAKKLLTELGRKNPEAVAPVVGKRFLEAGENNLAVRLPLMELLRDLGPGAQPALSAVLEGLGSEDFDIRQQAVRTVKALGSSAKKAVPELLDMLRVTEDALLRKEIVETLAIIDIDDPSTVPKLVKMLDEQHDAMIRRFALRTLADLGAQANEAVPKIITVAKNAEDGIKSDAIGALGKLGTHAPEQVVPALVTMVEDGEPSATIPAINALGAIGPKAGDAVVVSALITMVKRGEFSEKIPAINALAAIGPKAGDAVPVLVAKGKQEDERIQKIIQRAVNRIKQENQPPVLEDVEVTCTEGQSVDIELGGKAKYDLPVALRLKEVEEPVHGSLEQTGKTSLTYTSKRGHTDPQRISYKMSDGKDTGSARITIKIEPDKTPPKISQLTTAENNKQIKLVFNEPIDKTTAAAEEHYAVDHGVEVRQATVKENRRITVLKTSPLEEEVKYTLTLRGIKDTAKAGNVIERRSHEFEYVRSMPGLRYTYHHPWKKGHLPEPEKFSEFDPVKTGTVDVPTVKVREHEERFTIKFSGRIDIPKQGEYTFFTASDNGSKLYIDGELVVDNGGTRVRTESGQVNLDVGKHSITVTYFKFGGGHSLSPSWQGPGFDKETIPVDVLTYIPQAVSEQ